MDCNDCKYAVFEDHGYSNWTVEGTDFSCARGLHPEGTFDRFYGDDPRLAFGATCSGFSKGDCLDIDVERDALDDLSPEQQVIWDMYQRN